MEIFVISNTGVVDIQISDVANPVKPNTSFGWKVEIGHPIVISAPGGQCRISHNSQRSEPVLDSNGETITPAQSIWSPDLVLGTLHIGCGKISDKIYINGNLTLSIEGV